MERSRAAKKEELPELARLQREIFRPGESIDRYLSYVFEDPTYSLDQTRVLQIEGEIVSHLRVWSRNLQFGHRCVRAGGIGSLLTVPTQRGKGYGGLLLQETEEYLKHEGYRLAFLFSSVGTSFYERFGWCCVPLPRFRIELVRPEMRPAIPEVHVRRLNWRDLEQVADLYRRETAGMIGPEVRSIDYWLSGPSRQRNLFPNWGIESRNGLGGYLHLRETDSQLLVIEAAIAPECIESAAEFVLHKAVLAGATVIDIELPDQHPLLIKLIERLPDRASLQMRIREELMAKILDPGLFHELNCPAEEGVAWLFRLAHPRQRTRTEEFFSQSDLWKQQAPYYWRSDAF